MRFTDPLLNTPPEPVLLSVSHRTPVFGLTFWESWSTRPVGPHTMNGEPSPADVTTPTSAVACAVTVNVPSPKIPMKYVWNVCVAFTCTSAAADGMLLTSLAATPQFTSGGVMQCPVPGFGVGQPCPL